jgi:amidase
MRRAGAIILGKTNLPPLADGPQTDNPIFGRTNNPWNQHCTPGGSSGGGAAAVAAGLSPLDIGSDIGGSLRLPAHFCGIYALKPTGNRVSILGYIASTQPLQLPDEWLWMLEMACAGPLARSVADLRLCLEVIAQPGTPPLLHPPPRPLRTLRIAWTDDMGDMPLTEGSRLAINSLADTLARAGCLVEHYRPAGFSYEEAWELSGKLLSYLNTLFKPRLTRLTRRFLSKFSNGLNHAHPVMRGLMKGPGLNAGQIEQLGRQRQAVIQQVEAFLSNWDAWICPVFPRPAYFHRPRNASIEVGRQELSQDLAEVMPNVIFNLTGHPAVVIPTGQTEDELPIGVQLVGRRWGEMELLEVAQQISQLIGPFRYPPGYQ